MGYSSIKPGKNFNIGEYCLIDDSVEIGDDVVIGNYVSIGPGCKIGDGTVLKSHIEIRQNTIIGKNCYIDSGVKTSGDCKIGDECTLRYDTIIARDVIIEDKVFMAPQCMTEYSDYKREKHEGTIICSACFIGTNVTISANVKICSDVVIGSKSLVKKDITVSGKYVGVPVKRTGDNDNLTTKSRGVPCQNCGRMLTERNSPCPVSVVCNDCRLEGSPNLCDGKDYSEEGDEEFVKKNLSS